MSNFIVVALTAVLASAVTAVLVNRPATLYDFDSARFEESYRRQLQQHFDFGSGFEFGLEDFRMSVYSEGRPTLQVFGSGSRNEIPIEVDLLAETGESIFAFHTPIAGVPLTESDQYFFEGTVGYWPSCPDLEMVATIYPGVSGKEQTLIRTVPNPIHRYRLLELSEGPDSTTTGIRTISKTVSR